MKKLDYLFDDLESYREKKVHWLVRKTRKERTKVNEVTSHVENNHLQNCALRHCLLRKSLTQSSANGEVVWGGKMMKLW